MVGQLGLFQLTCLRLRERDSSQRFRFTTGLPEQAQRVRVFFLHPQHDGQIVDNAFVVG